MEMKPPVLDTLNNYKGRPLRFLMVMPKFPPSFWSFCHVGRLFGRATAWPPLGLLTVGGMCPPEWELRLVDENVDRVTDADLEWADLVGFSTMIVQYSRAVHLARRARAMGKPTIIGGNHVTGEPEVYENEIDVLIRNEGEITFRRFLEDYAKGQVVARYETQEKADLAQTPLLRLDLLRRPRRYPVFVVQYGRGCPYNCEFCDVVSMFGRRWRYRRVEDVLGELDRIHAFGHRGTVAIADDNFNANRAKAMEMCGALEVWNRRHGYPFVYHTQTTPFPLAADEEMMSAMRKARFEGVFLGLESPSAESLRSAGKTHNLRGDIPEAVRKIQSFGLRVDAGIMVGFDGDTKDIFDRQARFIDDLDVTVVQTSVLSAFPSSPLYQRMKAEGRLLFERTPLNLEEGFGVYNCIGLPNIVPKQFSNSELMEGYARLISEIYGPRQYFERVVRQVAALKPDFRNRRLALRAYLWSFPAWSLLIFCMFPFRFHYLRAALKVLFRYPGGVWCFKESSMRGIHFLEFTRRDVVPRALAEAQRFAEQEKRVGLERHRAEPEPAPVSAA